MGTLVEILRDKSCSESQIGGQRDSYGVARTTGAALPAALAGYLNGGNVETVRGILSNLDN